MKIKDVIESDYFEQTNATAKLKELDVYVAADGYIIAIPGGDIDLQITAMYSNPLTGNVTAYTHNGKRHKLTADDDIRLKVYQNIKVL